MSNDITQPLVSVCIPVYNGAEFVAETIESVLQQSFKDFQLLIQDNCSTDETGEILNDYAQRDGRVSVEANQELVSMAANWNRVINRAHGKYIMLISADDLLSPGFLEECMSILENDQGLAVVTTEHRYLKSDGVKRRKMWASPGKRRLSCHEVLLKNPFLINFTLFRRDKLMKYGLGRRGVFREPYFACDFDLWIRLALAGEYVYFIPHSLGMYRVHSGALSRKLLKVIKHIVLVLSANQSDLRRQCRWVHKITMVRMLVRLYSYRLRGIGANHRLEKFLLGRIFCG